MSNPIILYKSRFEDGGALSATNTATGYDVNNIKDLRNHTFWKANAAGTLYIIEAPLLKDSLAQEEMRIVPADGYAKVYLPASLDLTDYLGDRIVCLDSALKKHIGYIKSVGTEKGVNLILSAVDAAMTVADDDDIDFGTGNFTLRIKCALPDYTPSAGLYLLNKMEGASPNLFGYQLYLHTDGKLYVILGTNSAPRNYASTAAISATDGTEHEIVAVITRETASVNGSVVFYVDGVQLGTSVAITAAAPTTLSNSAVLYINGGASFRNASINKKITLYNRALTAGEALSLYESGVAVADQYGSQTAVYTSDFSVGVDSWLSGRLTLTGNIDAIGGENDWLRGVCTNVAGFHVTYRVAAGTVPTAGRRYRVSYKYYIPSGQSNLDGIRMYIGGVAGSVNNTLDAATTVTEEITAASTSELSFFGLDGGSLSFTDAGGNDVFYVKDIVVTEIGATLNLNESNIGDTGWTDASTNGNDASYPASGSAVVLGNNIVSTPGGSTYNWESIEGGFNYNDAAGYTYKISEADAVDALGIEGHNLGTAGAAVSVESSDDESTWTERLAAFNPSDDTAILKTMTSFRAASKRLKIVTASVAPYIACALLGDRLDFNRGAYIGDGAIVPWQFGIVAAAQRSKTGNLLGNTIRYKPVDISMTIPTDDYDWYDTYFWPFWRDHGSELKPFFFAPDLTTFTDKIFWLQLTEDSVLAPPMLMKDRVDQYTFIMRGVLEE